MNGTITRPRSFDATLSTALGELDAVHALLGRVWADAPEVRIDDRIRFETALIELAGNVLEHAVAGAARECRVEVVVTAAELSALVRDRGPAVAVCLERDMPDDLAEDGRGIALIRALTDELSYERDGEWNRWRIRRRLAPPSR